MRNLRHSLISFFLILLSFNSFGQGKLENEILAGFINSFYRNIVKDTVFEKNGKIKKINVQYLKRYLVLRNTTVSNQYDNHKRSLSTFNYNGPAMFHLGLKLIDSAMYSDFIEKNQTKIAIDSVPNFVGSIAYISENELENIFKNGRWGTFREIYGSRPLIGLSRPGINVKKNRALIYVENSTDGLAGMGIYVILEKLNGKWMVKEWMEVWES